MEKTSNQQYLKPPAGQGGQGQGRRASKTQLLLGGGWGSGSGAGKIELSGVGLTVSPSVSPSLSSKAHALPPLPPLALDDAATKPSDLRALDLRRLRLHLASPTPTPAPTPTPHPDWASADSQSMTRQFLPLRNPTHFLPLPYLRVLPPPDLPAELWVRILCFLPSLSIFCTTSKSIYLFLKDAHVRQLWLSARYGLSLSIRGALSHYRRIVIESKPLLSMLRKAGANIPRFLVQMAFEHYVKKIDSGAAQYLDFLVSEYCRERGYIAVRPQSEKNIDSSLFRFPNGIFTNMERSKAQILCYGQDSKLFEQLLNGIPAPLQTTNATSSNEITPLDQLRDLIIKEEFIPIVELNPTSLFRIFQLSQLDMHLLDVMINSNGFRVSKVNDEVIRRVIASNLQPVANSSLREQSSSTSTVPKLSSLGSIPPLSAYLSRGFKISHRLIKSILLDSVNGQHTSLILRTISPHITRRHLAAVARDIGWEMFGPQGTFFNPHLITELIEFNLLTSNDVQLMLVGDRGSDAANIDKIPYTTRCYEQSHPQIVWLWVLRKFGGSHVFTQYCFDDLLQWLGDLSQRADRYQATSLDRKARVSSSSGSSNYVGFEISSEAGSSSNSLDSGASVTFNPFSSYVGPFLEAGVIVLPRHVQFLAKAARSKRAAPMPAMVLSMALRKLVQRRDQLDDLDDLADAERMRDRNNLAVAAAAASATSNGSNALGRSSSKKRKTSKTHLGPPAALGSGGGIRRGDSRDRTVHKRGVSRDTMRGNVPLPNSTTFMPITTTPPALPTMASALLGNNGKIDSGKIFTDATLSTGIQTLQSGFANIAITDARARVLFENECMIWVEAIRVMFSDSATIKEIKRADADWFKEFKAESEAQDRKDLMSVGLPVKKSWSGGG
ncbi:hypothetical protein HK100_005529, partial [Physocladia obscura]